MDKAVVAICYDFDKTLSPKYMQEYSLFPKLGVDASEFWKESNDIAKNENMDKMLSYMCLILKTCYDKKVVIKENDFKEMGKEVKFYDGIDTWFDRINNYAASVNIEVEHYIISSGLKEIIEGTSINKYFKKIYASSYLYNEDFIPVWPKQVVNYTQKTQYLFRISKNCLNLDDEESVNNKMTSDQKRIPFRNIIYIGDSDTDIPAMKIVKNKGGISIGVYDSKDNNTSKVANLIKDSTIDFSAPADYKEGSIIESHVKSVLLRIKHTNSLTKILDSYDDEINLIKII